MKRMRISRQHRVTADERQRRMEAERLRAIYELTSTLTATLSYKRVLDSALDLGYSALNPNFDPDEPIDERLVSAVLLFKGNELTIGSARRFTNADMRANLPGKEGILKKIFDDGEAVLTRDIGYDAYAQEIAARVVAAYRRIEWKNATPLQMAERKLTLNFRVPDDARLAWAKELTAKLGDRLPQSQAEIYAGEAIYLNARQKAELKLQALRIGDLGITTIPNEVYAITGLKIKDTFIRT